MNCLKSISVVILFLFPITFVAGQQEPKPQRMELHGYIKNLQTAYFIDNIDSIALSNLIHNRLNLKFNISSKLKARLEIRNRIFYGDLVKQIPDFGNNINQYNGFFNLSKLWVNKKSFVAQSVIDRMLVQYTDDKWDIQLGRQRINWGITNIWNPNDIFNTYNFMDFDYEERPGNDALRIQHFMSSNTSVELAYKPGKNKDETIAALLYKLNKWEYDFQFLSGIYQSDFVLGCGWAGNIKDAGFKGEVTYFHPKKNAIDTASALLLSLMADRTFKNNWYVSLSVLYNSNPTNSFESSGSILNSNVSAKSPYPFRYNFYTGIMKTISPITSLNLSLIYSPEKNTLIIFPTFAWNVATNFDVDFVAQSFFANQSNTYKAQGNAFFIRGRWSF